MNTPKSQSVTKEGEVDGWTVPAGFQPQIDEEVGSTRVLVSVAAEFLARVHRDLLRAITPPLGVLYRQKIDRLKPRPNGAPPRDFLALEVPPEVLYAALDECADLLFHDARCELWVRGARGEQVIVDEDGLIFCYPDDPVFHDVCRGWGLPESKLATLQDRDYVKHWYHAENDALEAGFIDGLGLVEMPGRR